MLLPLQGVNAVAIHNPGCRFACPGLCAPLGFQPALAKSETSVIFHLSLHMVCAVRKIFMSFCLRSEFALNLLILRKFSAKSLLYSEEQAEKCSPIA